METSGTVLLQPALAGRWIDQWNVSPKLASSGNPRRAGRCRRRYAGSPRRTTPSKFVITAPEDVEEARGWWSATAFERVLLMPEGHARLAERSAWLVGRCQALGYRYSTRLHVLLWGTSGR